MYVSAGAHGTDAGNVAGMVYCASRDRNKDGYLCGRGGGSEYIYIYIYICISSCGLYLSNRLIYLVLSYSLKCYWSI